MKRAIVKGVICWALLFTGGPGAGPGGGASARAAAPSAPADSSRPTVAAAKPLFSVADLDAIRGLMRKARGHVVLVHFWASWCFPCLQELPIIDRFAKEMRPRGVEVLSLSLDNPATMGARVGALLQRTAPNLTTVIAKFDDPDRFISGFNPRWEGAIPAIFAYDQQGQPRGSLMGEATRQELDDLVGQLLRAAPAAASSAKIKN
jgi:thiol-disulfide isomerase/thioredoxin